jgi:formylglycine-generating enzyme required for sulfatase activity
LERVRSVFLASGALLGAILVAAACTAFGTGGPDSSPLADGGADDARVAAADGSRGSVADARPAGEVPIDDAGCPATPPRMVRITGYCIDSTEVTQSQYAAFLDSAPRREDQPDGCASNTSFVKHNDGNIDVEHGPLPVSATWCDAYMYCKWAGKRLCGAIGGGASPYGTTDPAKSEWLEACSRGGSRAHPYGATSDAGACNDGPIGGAVVEVGSFTDCVGGYPGIFDMEGNVSEWVDECEPGPTGVCAHRGGSFATEMRTCDQYESHPRDVAFTGYGFRCCADAR